MKYHLKHKATIILILLFCSFTTFGSDIPSRPNPPRMVNDLAGILSSTEIQYLENKLIAYNDSTSTQIVVLTVKSLNGYSANEFAYEIGEKWGVGQDNLNNGVVVLIKPKIGNEYGEVAIGVGYGLEEYLTDALSRRIIERVILPEFRQGNIFTGIDKGVDTIIDILLGTYKNKESSDDEIGAIISFLFIFGIIVLILILSSKGKNGGGGTPHNGGNSSDLLNAIILGSMLGRGSSGSSFGGFGGFGGGHFGGGGASGRW